jgi:alcohol dehydrogenase class IV
MDWVLALRAELKIPNTLAELGVDDARIDKLSAMAAVDPTAGGNPLPLDPANCKALFRDCLEGTYAA